MKTRERILQTGRELFNESGEASVTVLDISLTLNISPGNLYYHFRSKEDILAHLFSHLIEAITPRLEELELALASLDHQPLILDALFETMWHFRFIYLDTYRLGQRYPKLKRRLVNLISHHESSFTRWIEQLETLSLLKFPTPDHRTLLIDNLTAQSVTWIGMCQLRYKESPESSRQRAVAQIISLLTQHFAQENPGEPVHFQSHSKNLMNDTVRASPATT